jgi:glutamate dehydrogenase (NAD(P)+)
VGRSVGLPRELGGIPLDEIGATGWGLMHAAEVAADRCGLALDGARVAVQGFGAVGRHAARYLAERGAVLVGASDSRGVVSSSGGLDIEALCALKDEGRSVAEYAGGREDALDAILDIDCDIWIPAARPDVLRADNVARLGTRVIVQGANIPATAEAEAYLHEKGVVNIPDFIANAGGVICAAMEYQGSSEAAVFAAIEEKIRRNTQEVLQAVEREGVTPRQGAMNMARSRIQSAMRYRRWTVFSSAPGFV